MKIDMETGLLLPSGSGGTPGGGGNSVFYKCSSVDSATWSGYKAVLTDGVYSFEKTVTEGLSYGTAFTPEVGKVYNGDATVRCSLYTGGYKFLRIQIDKKRGFDDNDCSIGEFVLFDESGNAVRWPDLGVVRTDTNTTPYEDQTPEDLFDSITDDVYNKWNFPFFEGAYATVELQIGIEPSKYKSYGWYTAGDAEWRDPVTWSIYLSQDGVTWTQFSSVANASITWERSALAGRWYFQQGNDI